MEPIAQGEQAASAAKADHLVDGDQEAIQTEVVDKNEPLETPHLLDRDEHPEAKKRRLGESAELQVKTEEIGPSRNSALKGTVGPTDICMKPGHAFRVQKLADGKIEVIGLTEADKDISAWKDQMRILNPSDLDDAASATTAKTGPIKTGNVYQTEAFKKNLVDQKNFLAFDVMKQLWKKKMQFPTTVEYHAKAKILRKEAESEGRQGPIIVPLPGDQKKGEDYIRGKLYLAPLTTHGNLPFRRICRKLGAEMTCGEMAMASNLLKGQKSEWALLRRHVEEDFFGVQIAGNNNDQLARCAELIASTCEVDFIDINSACPIDIVYTTGAGCGLMDRRNRLMEICNAVSNVIHPTPLSIKFRIGVNDKSPNAHKLLPAIQQAGAKWATIHGRSRLQRYSKAADWDYLVKECVPVAKSCGLGLILNGDIYSWHDVDYDALDRNDYSTIMVARGAIVKPWIFTEIKERRDWDITAVERLEYMKDYCRYGLDHWGADKRGVETTRKFFLEWMSFAWRYCPLGLVETMPVRMGQRVPPFKGRNELETLFGSHDPKDWVKISEAMLGPVPDDFSFTPKHKSEAWSVTGSSMQARAGIAGGDEAKDANGDFAKSTVGDDEGFDEG